MLGNLNNTKNPVGLLDEDGFNNKTNPLRNFNATNTNNNNNNANNNNNNTTNTNQTSSSTLATNLGADPSSILSHVTNNNNNNNNKPKLTFTDETTPSLSPSTTGGVVPGGPSLNSVTSPGGDEPSSVETDIDTLLDNPPESFDLVEMFNV